MKLPVPSCFRLFMQAIRLAFSFALARAGSSSAAKIAMMAITTNSSIRVKARQPGAGFKQRPFSKGGGSGRLSLVFKPHDRLCMQPCSNATAPGCNHNCGCLGSHIHVGPASLRILDKYV